MRSVGNTPSARVGVLLVILSAACFGALGVLSQLAYHAGVCVLGLLSGRFVLAATILWLAVAGLRRPVSWNRGIAAYVGSAPRARASCRAPEPALTAAFALVVLGDRIGVVEILGAALVLASVPILELKPRSRCLLNLTPAYRPA